MCAESSDDRPPGTKLARLVGERASERLCERAYFSFSNSPRCAFPDGGAIRIFGAGATTANGKAEKETVPNVFRYHCW